MNHYLTFGANNETYTQISAVISRIALTQTFLVEPFMETVSTTMSTTPEVPTSTISPLVSSLVRTEKSLQEMVCMLVNCVLLSLIPYLCRSG